MKKQSAVTVSILVAIFLLVIFLLSFFLWEHRSNNISKENAYLTESFHDFQNNQNSSNIENIINSNEKIIYNQELKDLILTSYYKRYKENEYVDLLESIIANNAYSNIIKSLAKIYFINWILSETEEVFLQYIDKSRKYLDYFQNADQEYFYFALFLKILFHEKTGEIELAKSYAKNLIARDSVNEFLKEQSKMILIQLENRN